MSVKIRLARLGSKKKPFYRIVAADIESPRNGKFLEVVGTYDPHIDPPAITLKEGEIRTWLDKGALPTDTVKSLFKKAGFQREVEVEGAGQSCLTTPPSKAEVPTETPA